MTTAHRPTYNPTKGGNMQGANKLYFPSLQYSSKDLPSNLKLKTRQPGQGSIQEIQRKNFKRQLTQREMKKDKKDLVSALYTDFDEFSGSIDFTSDLLFEVPKKKHRLDSESLNTSEIKSKDKFNLEYIHEIDDEENVFPQDKDLEYEDDQQGEDHHKSNINNYDVRKNVEDDDCNNEDEDDEDDEDDEEMLFKEYEKIKKMKEEENRLKEIEESEKIKLQIQEQILVGNPLLNVSGYSLKKKWFEDTIFKNQAKNEPKTKKRFINDTVRSDFHKKFLSKTMQ